MEEEKKYLLIIPKEMLLPKNVVEFTRVELGRIEHSMETTDQNITKLRLNSISNVLSSNNYEDKIFYSIFLNITHSLIMYGQIYNSVETIINAKTKLNSKDHKIYLSQKHPFEYKYYNAFASFALFNANLKATEDNYLNKDELLSLIESKYYLLKIYLHHIQKINTIAGKNLFDTINLLSAVLSQLSRWPECIEHLNSLKIENYPNFNLVEYLKAIALNEIKNKTCLDYNGLLLLAILNSCENANLISDKMLTIQKTKISRTIAEINKNIITNNIDLPNLRKHSERIKSESFKTSHIQKFNLENNLYLNEHSFFCQCSNIKLDDLKISTRHKHTHIQWVKDRNDIVQNIKSSFNLSRIEFYYSHESSIMRGSHVNLFDKTKIGRQFHKYALLKSSFRRCYSLLDNIGISILEDLDLHYHNLKDKYENKQNIYFFNIWELGLIKDINFTENQFLHALYSISKDLDQHEFSALKQFKNIRNSIEHNIFLIGDYKKETKEKGVHKMPYKEMLLYTKILLSITRSAIFSYVYFLRRQSKLIHIKPKLK